MLRERAIQEPNVAGYLRAHHAEVIGKRTIGKNDGRLQIKLTVLERLLDRQVREDRRPSCAFQRRKQTPRVGRSPVRSIQPIWRTISGDYSPESTLNFADNSGLFISRINGVSDDKTVTRKHARDIRLPKHIPVRSYEDTILGNENGEALALGVNIDYFGGATLAAHKKNTCFWCAKPAKSRSMSWRNSSKLSS